MFHYYQRETDGEARQRSEEKGWIDELLGWLTFAEIDDRREQVPKAHGTTFKWIFEEDNDLGFVDWLRDGKGIFWINGKPASGKSTLMKFIMQEDGPEDSNGVRGSMLEHLSENWAGDTRLVIAPFWFWAAGSRLQRSLLGLYRTLLFRILKADNSLCRVAFPHWHYRFKEREPTMEMVTFAMGEVLRYEETGTKFLFVVDGMDEYESDSMGKADLAWLMLDMAASSRVKWVISSRPEAHFKTAFRRCQSLCLQTLTKPDIREYVDTKLSANPRLRDILDHERDGIKEIANFIIDNAHGVFLWVALVVRLTLDGVNDHEEPLAIHDRIMLLPRELNEMFNHILMERIEERYRQEAFRYLLIARQCVASLDSRPMLADVMVASQEASSYEVACELATSDLSKREATGMSFQDRVIRRCHGLLECDNSRVNFLHRSLFDYLDQEVREKSLLKPEAGEAFEVNTAIMAGLVCGRKRFISIFPKASLVQAFFRFNKLAECSSGEHRSSLVETFDRIMAKENPTVGKVSKNVNPHWSNAEGFEMFGGIAASITKPKNGLLALAVFMDGTLYLKEAIRKREVSGTESMSLLLLFATLPYALPESGPFIIPDDYTGTPTILLENGADPAHFCGEWCPWSILLKEIVERPKSSQLTPWIPGTKMDRTAAALRLLGLFARKAPDLHKCSTIRADNAITISYKALEAIQHLVLGDYCCGGRRVQECQCLKARMWQIHAADVVSLLKTANTDLQTPTRPPEASTSERRSLRSRYLQGGLFAKLLPSRSRSRTPG